jgi:micrococcal nuclease
VVALLAVLGGERTAGLVVPQPASGVVVSQPRFVLCRSGPQHSCVIDGDTIRYGGERIRLLDIDAPETRGAQCPSEAELAERATLRLLELINEGPFELVPRGSRDRDVYGRQLRVLMRDGRSLGGILVEEGLARPWEGRRRSWCG